MKDYYKEMDLATNATQEEIRGQFRRLAKEYHPDKNNSDYARQRFAQINEAYSVLSDIHKKNAYDSQRQAFFKNVFSHHHKAEQSTNRNDFFSSPLWGQVKNFASGMAHNFVEELDREIHEEYDDVDPFVERIAKIKVRHNNSGSISLNCTISPESLSEITSLASRGMDIEEFSADVGTMFASALTQALMTKWKGY
jgi:DnaJ-class molecular chaperone